eukprot:TRINITY_DN7807_c0_g1_i1.p2 TRINITY_DN7807_c0_g1~~TRINITY_DN7807_c0_g1_i1.p2  ORF type:complete len:110 (+),score=26.18 TRINITY_DN7807_c0_g1_i1:311-640(+)
MDETHIARLLDDHSVQKDENVGPCIAWRRSNTCSRDKSTVFDHRAPFDDLPCDALVPADVPGYCECHGARRKYFCNHVPLRCEHECAVSLKKAGHKVPERRPRRDADEL